MENVSLSLAHYKYPAKRGYQTQGDYDARLFWNYDVGSGGIGFLPRALHQLLADGGGFFGIGGIVPLQRHPNGASQPAAQSCADVYGQKTRGRAGRGLELRSALSMDLRLRSGQG